MELKLLRNEELISIYEKQIKELLEFLYNNTDGFDLTVNLDIVSFNPDLPKHLAVKLHGFTRFTLVNYTFESIEITNNEIKFEAGFGAENFGSVVSVPFISIYQIILDESMIYLNPIATLKDVMETKKIEKNSRNKLRL